MLRGAGTEERGCETKKLGGLSERFWGFLCAEGGASSGQEDCVTRSGRLDSWLLGQYGGKSHFLRG